MKKVVLLPLDERPCNYQFPYKLFSGRELSVVRPDELGDKKEPANSEKINEFLIKACKDADYLVLSMDMLLYGGLIPSRLHHHRREEIQRRLETIKQLKEANKRLKIYAFQCIMRCPVYSSSDEEPDYYGQYGAEIHKIGALEHKVKIGLAEESQLRELYEAVDGDALTDYRERRKFNLFFNLETMDYLKQGTIDFLVIPQDDSAEYGFTAMDQEVVYEKIRADLLQFQVLMYPGADEVAMTLLARIVNETNNKVPKVFVKYASVHAPFLIPSFEDRALGETLKYHILAAGCRMADTSSEADLILAVNAPADGMKEAAGQPVNNKSYRTERNITEFLLSLEELIKEGKPVTIGDNAFANGADLELIALLNKRGLLFKLAGYAGWNTSSNTIGTAISEGIRYLYCGDTAGHRDFLALRYAEDAGYCARIRSFVTSEKLPALGMDYFDVKERDGIVSGLVKELLQEFINENLSSISGKICLKKVSMPWRRMFEVDIDVNCII